MATAKYVPNRALGAQLARQFIGLGTQAGFVMEREAKRRTPVDTGTLRNGYHTDVDSVSNQGVHVEVGNNVNYAVYVEKGTSKMEGHHMLANAVAAAARWLAKRGLRVEYLSNRGR